MQTARSLRDGLRMVSSSAWITETYLVRWGYLTGSVARSWYGSNCHKEPLLTTFSLNESSPMVRSLLDGLRMASPSARLSVIKERHDWSRTDKVGRSLLGKMAEASLVRIRARGSTRSG